jgi:hypothetical protein
VATGNALWNRPQRYRRRRPLPAILLMVALCLAAIVVWLKVFRADTGETSAITCNPPHSTPAVVSGQPPTSLGQTLEPDALDRTIPVAPALVQVRVVNASETRGQAAETTEMFRQLGFGQVAAPANDTLYTASELDCRAQIRFGQQGTAAARTLSLVEPCAQLVKDNREDATVDFAIGNKFDDLRPKSETRRILEALTSWSLQHPEVQGGLQANENVQPDLDAGQLRAARDVTC